MARKIAGFTLIEVLVVLVILGVMLGLAIPSYTHWQRERQLTSDTKKVHNFVQEERARAYSTKRNIVLTIDDTTTICDNIGNCVQTDIVFTVSSPTPPTISISSRGVYQSGHIRIKDDTLRQKYDPNYSCVVFTLTRARLGRYDGSNCNAQ